MENKLDTKELYTIRMFVFMETEPQSNKYEQILFNDKQYKEVTKVVFDQFPRVPNHKCDDPNCEGVALETSGEPITLPDKSEIHI